MKVEVAFLLWLLRLAERVGQQSPGQVASVYQCEVACECNLGDSSNLILVLCGVVITLATAVIVLTCALLVS